MAESGTHYRWDDLPREELNPSIGRRLITGDQMMIAQVYIAKGGIVPQHSHENEQLTYILEGTLRIWLGADGGQFGSERPRASCSSGASGSPSRSARRVSAVVSTSR
jgi:hypothetical protein